MIIGGIILGLGERVTAQEEGSEEAGEEEGEGDGDPAESVAEEEGEPEEGEPDLSEEEPELDDPFVPGMEEPVIEDDGDYYGEGPEEAELPDFRPYGKGEMGLSIMLGAGGLGDYFTLSIGASFEYYVIARLAPGLMIIYSATWGDYEYPQSLWTMPFLKFVLIRSNKFAPYIIAGAGRDFEWGGTDDPTKGYKAVSSWFGGPGGGAHIGIGAHVRLNLMIMAHLPALRREGHPGGGQRRHQGPLVSILEHRLLGGLLRSLDRRALIVTLFSCSPGSKEVRSLVSRFSCSRWGCPGAASTCWTRS